MGNKVIYNIEISFQEKSRDVVKEKLRELKELVESYHQLRDYNKEHFGEGLDWID